MLKKPTHHSLTPKKDYAGHPDRASLEAEAQAILGFDSVKEANTSGTSPPACLTLLTLIGALPDTAIRRTDSSWGCAELDTFVIETTSSQYSRRNALLELERLRESNIRPAEWRQQVSGGAWGPVDSEYSGPGLQAVREGFSGVCPGPPHFPVVPYESLCALRDRREPSCWRVKHGEECTVQDVYNVLTHPNGYILDCSPRSMFNAMHVRSAVCMSDALHVLQSLDCTWADVHQAIAEAGGEIHSLPKPKVEHQSITESCRGYTSDVKVLVYGTNMVAAERLACLACELEPNECYVLTGGIDAVHEERPYICRKGPTESDHYLPSEVVKDFLYIGGVREAKDLKMLRSIGVTTVLNCTDDVEHFYIDREFDYFRVSVSDCPNSSVDIANRFEIAVDWVEQVRQAGGKVLVHCTTNVSRSATIALAWMVKYGGYSLRDAVRHVRKVCARATPNIGFLNELARWEQFINLDRPTPLGTVGSSTVEYLHMDNSGDGFTWALPVGVEPNPKNIKDYVRELGIRWL